MFSKGVLPVPPYNPLFPLGCHSIILIVHLLSFLVATWPSAHLHLSCLILCMMSVTPVCFLMDAQLYFVTD